MEKKRHGKAMQNASVLTVTKHKDPTTEEIELYYLR